MGIPAARKILASVAPLVLVRGVCFLFSTNSQARMQRLDDPVMRIGRATGDAENHFPFDG